MKKRKDLALSTYRKRTVFERITAFIKNRVTKRDKTKHQTIGQPLTEEKVGMVKEKAPAPKGPFSSIAMKKDNGEWYTLMVYEDTFGADVSEAEKKQKLGELSENVRSSRLSEENKKTLLDYIGIAASGGGRFSMVHSQVTTLSYLDGDVPNEQLLFEFELMKAWCSGKIPEFLEKQRKELGTKFMGEKERKMLNEMIDLALTRESDTMRAVAAINLCVYFEGKSEMDRIKKFENMSRVFSFAAPAE